MALHPPKRRPLPTQAAQVRPKKGRGGKVGIPRLPTKANAKAVTAVSKRLTRPRVR